MAWSNVKELWLAGSKYRPSPSELNSLTMTSYSSAHSSFSARSELSYRQTATRKLDCGELLFAIFLEGWAQRVGQTWLINGESLDICMLRQGWEQHIEAGSIGIPAMTLDS